ncbi:MAG: inner membrane protein [Candidatus Azotimanducaceae bacterium]|jgi:inner membrane protein
MDPITQGALGAALPLSVSNRKKLASTALLGCLAGMAPDIDVFIRSPTDPILFLEYHRQFTHSLIFIPLGALICALLAFPISRKTMPFKTSYIICLLGYGTHALIDACTSYGTLLAWPFNDTRYSWNNVSVVDPMVTLPLLLMIALAIRQNKASFARIGMVWVFAYLLLGLYQNHRVETFGLSLANSRGHFPKEVSAKPGFGNIILWKVIYKWDDFYYVDGVRSTSQLTLIEGESIPALNIERDLPWLDPFSQQAKDLDRFNWFSQGYLAIDKKDPLIVIDMRYSMLPNEINALWGIRFDPNAKIDQHIDYVSNRDVSQDRRDKLWIMLKGQY